MYHLIFPPSASSNKKKFSEQMIEASKKSTLYGVIEFNHWIKNNISQIDSTEFIICKEIST